MTNIKWRANVHTTSATYSSASSSLSSSAWNISASPPKMATSPPPAPFLPIHQFTNPCPCHRHGPSPPLSAPIFHGCVNEHLVDRTPSPTFSTSDSEITEMADERHSEMSDLLDDEAFADDASSDAGTEEEGSDLFSDGQDPFYDRSPWFSLVGRLVVTFLPSFLGSLIPSLYRRALREDWGQGSRQL